MPSMYGWIIDTDHLAETGEDGGRDDSETVGPHDIPDALEERLENGEGERFKMYDDDEVLYYTGRIVGRYTGFEPLEDFGEPNAGATTIHYFSRGKWRQL